MKKVTQNMLLALEIYERNVARKPMIEIYEMIDRNAGCTPEQLNNALAIIKRQRKVEGKGKIRK